MKTIIGLILVVFLITLSAGVLLAAPDAQDIQACGVDELKGLQGCCSHHGGVYGCDAYGRVICNDRTTSPSCRCP